MKKIKPLLIGFVALVIGFAIFQATVLFILLGQLHSLSEYEHNVTDQLVDRLVTTKYDIVQVQQYLTDSAATQEADGKADAAKALQDAQTNLAKIASLSSEMGPASQNLSQQVQKLFDTGVVMVAAYGESREAGNALMKSPTGFDAQSDEAQKLIDQLDVRVNELQKTTTMAVEEKTSAIGWISTSLAVLLAVLVTLGGVVLYRLIIKLLGGEPCEGQLAAQYLERGDLTYVLKVKEGDRDSLMASLAKMRARWTDVVSGLNGQSMMLFDHSQRLSGQAEQLSSASGEQSSHANRIAANIEELSVTMTHITQQSEAAFEQVSATGLAAKRTTGVLQKVTTDIREVEQSVGISAQRIGLLHQKMEEINSIVIIIREVSEQINLLALNAAIEAARAGEAGRGFAVVADEVRKLAERTGGSTKSIGDMIQNVGTMTNDIVHTIEQSVQRVGSGVSLIDVAQTEMQQVLSASEMASQGMQQIHDALAEVSSNTDDIARAVEQIARMSEANTVASNTVAVTSGNINQVAEALRSDTAYFKLDQKSSDMLLF